MKFGYLLALFGVLGATLGLFPLQEKKELELSATPDAPVSFGYKICWFAIKSENSKKVTSALGLNGWRPANWKSGIDAAYSQRSIFVSPPVEGWIFVVSSHLPAPDQLESGGRINHKFMQMFESLAQKFSEVQFFGTHRVVGFDAWARAKEGHIIRMFSIADGKVFANVGNQTPEERSLGLVDLSGLSLEEAFDAAVGTTDESQTMAMAAAWSVDPSRLEERRLPPGVGLVALLSKDWP